MQLKRVKFLRKLRSFSSSWNDFVLRIALSKWPFKRVSPFKVYQLSSSGSLQTSRQLFKSAFQDRSGSKKLANESSRDDARVRRLSETSRLSGTYWSRQSHWRSSSVASWRSSAKHTCCRRLFHFFANYFLTVNKHKQT